MTGEWIECDDGIIVNLSQVTYIGVVNTSLEINKPTIRFVNIQQHVTKQSFDTVEARDRAYARLKEQLGIK